MINFFSSVSLRLTFLAVLLIPFYVQANPTSTPRLAAASSLQFVLPEILAEFKNDTGYTARVTFGSSGNFSRQIMQGALYDLFLSADESYIDVLVEQGLTIDSGHIYALGRIALIVPEASQIKLTENLSGISDAIANAEIKHFSIANPDHAPYGRAARESLMNFSLWQSIKPFVIKGENASQATQFAISGSSQGGIVPYALAISPVISNSNRVMLIPQSSHQPIGQRMVLLKGSNEVAKKLYDFIGSAKAKAILKRFGYEVAVVSEQ